jgi:cytochrome P450
LRPTSEIVGLTFALYLTGIETTAALTTSVFKLLAEHPEQRALVQADPGLAANAVEEAVRFDPPLQATGRTCTTDTVFAGTPGYSAARSRRRCGERVTTPANSTRSAA